MGGGKRAAPPTSTIQAHLPFRPPSVPWSWYLQPQPQRGSALARPQARARLISGGCVLRFGACLAQHLPGYSCDLGLLAEVARAQGQAYAAH